MSSSFPSLAIVSINLVNSRSIPPFHTLRVIEITCQIPLPCSNPDYQNADMHITTVECLTHILRYCAVPQDQNTISQILSIIDRDSRITDEEWHSLQLDRPHVQHVMFRGDFVDKRTFPFIQHLIHLMDLFDLGMYVGAESFGSEDKTRIPQLLMMRKLDEVGLKLRVYPEWNDIVKQKTENLLNSFTQCIAGLRHFSSENEKDADIPDLKSVFLIFLFDTQSSLDVFQIYIQGLYDAIWRDGDPDLFEMFDIFLCYAGSTPLTKLDDQAYQLAIYDKKFQSIFNPETIHHLIVNDFYSECYEEK